MRLFVVCNWVEPVSGCVHYVDVCLFIYVSLYTSAAHP